MTLYDNRKESLIFFHCTQPIAHRQKKSPSKLDKEGDPLCTLRAIANLNAEEAFSDTDAHENDVKEPHNKKS